MSRSDIPSIINDVFAGAVIDDAWWEVLKPEAQHGAPRVCLAAACVTAATDTASQEDWRWAWEVLQREWSGEERVFAIYSQGLALYWGRGVPENREQGLLRVEEAAKLGFAAAQAWLGEIFISCINRVDADHLKAGYWLDKALINPCMHSTRKVGVLINKATIALQIENWNEAADWCSRIIDPSSGATAHERAAALKARGVIHGKLGRLKQELADYDSAIAMDGCPLEEKAECLCIRGITHRDQGNLEAAVQDFSLVIEMAGASSALRAKASYNKALIHMGRGDFVSALADFSFIIALPNSPPEFFANAAYNRGLIYQNQDQSDAALRDYTTVIEMEKPQEDERAMALVNRGNLYRDNGFGKEAQADFTSVIEMANAPADPKARALFNRGNGYRLEEQLDEAVGDYTAVLQIADAPPEPKVWSFWGRGDVRRKLGRMSEAVRDFSAAIEMRDAPAGLIARCLVERGNHFARINKHRKARADWIACMGLPCAAKDKAEAISHLRQCGIIPKQTTTLAPVNRALVEGLTGNPFAAIRLLDEIITGSDESAPDSLQAREHRGYLWHLLGNDAAANEDGKYLLASPAATADQKEAAKGWLSHDSCYRDRLKRVVEAVGADMDGLREGVRAIGPIYNQYTAGGLVIPGSRSPARGLPSPAFASCDGVWVDPDGTLKIVGAPARSSQDAFVWDEDVEVALILAFLEVPAMQRQPSFSLEAPPDHPELKKTELINYCEFTPKWLGSTGFGQTLFYCDYIFKLNSGLLPPSRDDPTLFAPEGCLHPLARLPDWVMELRWDHNDPGIAENWGRWCWKLRGLKLKRRPVRKSFWSRSNGEMFQIQGAEMYVDTSLIRGNGTDQEDRSILPNDLRTFVAKQGRVITDRYDDLCELFPAFSRLRELLKLYAALDEMRRAGVRLSPSQEKQLRQSHERYLPRPMKSLFVPRIPRACGCCYGGISCGCDDSQVSTGGSFAVPDDRHVSSGSSNGYAQIQREVSVSDVGREVVTHQMVIEPNAPYARAEDNTEGQRADARARAEFRASHDLSDQESRYSAFHVFASAFGVDPADKDNLVAGGSALNTAFYKTMEKDVKDYVERTGCALHATAEVTMDDQRGFFRKVELTFTDAEGNTPPELAKYVAGSNLVIANFPDHSTKESRAFLKSNRGK